MKQASFSDAEFANKKKQTRRDRFLPGIEAATPWPEPLAAILPYYPKGDALGRLPAGSERMRRMYIAQQYFGLSDDGFDDQPSHAVLATLDGAMERRHLATRNLWFDVALIAQNDTTPQEAAELVRRLRQIGMERVVHGTDLAQGDNLRPRAAWAAFRKLPLAEAEFKQVAGNVAPYFR